MDINNKYCFYIGTARGVVASSQCKPGETAKFDLQQIDKSNEITALQWGRKDDEIIIGYKSGATRLYNTFLGEYTACITNEEGKGAVVGAEVSGKNIILGQKNGHVNIWRKNKNRGGFNLKLDDKGTLETMVCNRGRVNVVGTGGESNDFKLWDIETKKCIFKAKSMGHDELNLPLPTTVRGISFFPQDEKLSVCVTKEGYILLYDERAQRRPINKFIEPKASYTTVTTAYRDMQCMVGTTKGYMQLIDLKRPSKCIKTFKSFTGSVTSIVCDPLCPVVASVSLDRYLRVHNIDTKELLHKEYLKQNLTKLIMRPVIKEETSKEYEDQKAPDNEKEPVIVADVDEEYDDLFNNMESVGDETVNEHKRKLMKNNTSKSMKKVKRKA